MKNVLITGSKGFIGKNLTEALRRNNDVVIKTFDADDDLGLLESHLRDVDFIYHLAGINRPQNPAEFETGNAQSTASIVEILNKTGRNVPILLTSSIQAERDNPYGKSKKAAEDILADYKKKTGAPIYVYRLPGVFGKWSRPNYNTVVATFCHNIARGFEINISDPDYEIELVYIDDVMRHFTGHLDHNPPQPIPLIKGVKEQSAPPVGEARDEGDTCFYKIDRTFKVTLGELAAKIYNLRDMRKTLNVPDLSDYFMRCLHATYLSFLDTRDFSYPMDIKTDNRGSLFELIKSEHFGQIFVSKTYKGITRGNHYHDSKIEKFCVIQGKAAIRFRNILNKDVIEYLVSDEKIEVVDIPPGYTHHIENLSDGEMIVLFWANQIFNPDKPDTYFEAV
ncbi:MAG: Capsular polysaccharide synthesis enzyme Cap5F [Candidatus Jettenia ecosi]|uniref:Capsular polysaccharide synthesis enzyme Cap5F n=1 Tax=Candidatus Jettenia ecosi TaxID=2494326 RepID=A0A533Q691_9BACT|nr:MAG: Capsular polysaccharide synthesis enzyme Cap5F [Candidatus Jettenia ecosi]